MCAGTLIDKQTVLTAAHCIITTVHASNNGGIYNFDVQNPTGVNILQKCRYAKMQKNNFCIMNSYMQKNAESKLFMQKNVFCNFFEKFSFSFLHKNLNFC